MRYGLLADIHGNLEALEATLDASQRLGVQRYLCAGDLVGYGPRPNECVARVATLGAICVAGNHDLMAVGALSTRATTRLVRVTMRWTRDNLSADSRQFLLALPLTARAAGGVVVTHGSLSSAQEYVSTPEQATDQLRLLAAERHGDRVLAIGHTHRPFAVDSEGFVAPSVPSEIVELGSRRWLLNPGAVGQSRDDDVRARFAVLDLDRGTTTFHAVDYDYAATASALRQAKLPADAYHFSRARPSVRLGLSRAGRRVHAAFRVKDRG